MNITGFCSAETLDFCWRDDIGKEQLKGFIDQVAQAGITQENVKRRFALANLPKVSFKSMQRESDWIACNQDVQFYLRKQKEAQSRRKLSFPPDLVPLNSCCSSRAIIH
jgi:hypothetical protein